MEKLNGHDPTPEAVNFANQMTSLHKAREEKIVEAICRMTGRTDYTEKEYYGMKDRGSIREYEDGGALFKFDGIEALLFHKIIPLPDGTFVQQIEYLYDKRDFEHHSAEDEKG